MVEAYLAERLRSVTAFSNPTLVDRSEETDTKSCYAICRLIDIRSARAEMPLHASEKAILLGLGMCADFVLRGTPIYQDLLHAMFPTLVAGTDEELCKQVKAMVKEQFEFSMLVAQWKQKLNCSERKLDTTTSNQDLFLGDSVCCISTKQVTVDGEKPI